MQALQVQEECRYRRVVLADDHRVVAQGIEQLLVGRFDSIELVTSGEALVESVRRDPPDVVVADAGLTGMLLQHPQPEDLDMLDEVMSEIAPRL